MVEASTIAKLTTSLTIYIVGLTEKPPIAKGTFYIFATLTVVTCEA